MYNLIEYQNRYYVKRKNIFTNNYNNIEDVLDIKGCQVSFELLGLMNMEDYRLLESLVLLESICGKRSNVIDLGYLYNSKGITDKKRVKCVNSLYGRDFYKFLDYLVYFVLPVYIRRNGFLKGYLSNNEVIFWLDDLSCFFNLKEGLDVGEKLKISFLLGGCFNKEMVFKYFTYLGIILER